MTGSRPALLAAPANGTSKMSTVLGISALYHDSAAALMVDGVIVSAVQQERVSRKKNDPSLPLQAIKTCLRTGGLTTDDLDSVVFYEDPFARLERVLLSCAEAFPHSWRQFPTAIRSQLGSKLWVVNELMSILNVPREKVFVTSHHRSHAASAFFASPFIEAAVVTVDGVGEDLSTAIWRGSQTSLECLATIEYPHSLGLLYSALTAYLGFEVNEGEYKVMGLAGFGTPRFTEEFSKLCRWSADGSFRLSLPYFAFHTDVELGFSPKLETLLGPRRPYGKPWNLAESDDRRYADIAASLQWVTEETLVAITKQARRLTSCSNLCLAGGVALNCVANARILKEAGFDHVFVQPAAGDAGGALGAAYIGAVALDGVRPSPMATAALGPGISNDVVCELAEKLGVSYSLPENALASAAQLICAQKVVALARGRCEWGPRALGNRSILAAPENAEMRDKINRVVKKREPFRPFAPAVLKAHADSWFSGCDNHMSPFMTTIGRVRADRLGSLNAVTHIDGTARAQTVDAISSPTLTEILTEVERRTGVPIVVNTSLNGNGEPIACSEVDVLAFFLSHPVDALIAGDVLLSRD